MQACRCAGFGGAFWAAYHELVPREPGFEARSDLYELYHKVGRRGPGQRHAQSLIEMGRCGNNTALCGNNTARAPRQYGELHPI